MVLIHALAFGGLYVLSFRIVMAEIVETYKYGAEVIFGEVTERFEGSMLRHKPPDIRRRIQRLARSHRFELELFDTSGKLLASSGAGASPGSGEEVADARAGTAGKTAWFVRSGEGFRLNGVQFLRNLPDCQGCHGAEKETLGALHLSLDLSEAMEATKGRLRIGIGALLVVWLGLAFVMIQLRRAVIERPLSRIEDAVRSITRHSRKDSNTRDLQSLVARLNKAIWTLVEGQKKRETSLKQHFARAEQMAALGELAAGLTHEIRNPLAGVSSALQLLRSEEPDPRSERSLLLDQTLEELNRASTTLDRLLRLARPEPPVKTTIDLAALSRDVARLFEPRLRGRRVRLSVEASEGLPALSLDRGQMTQLLLNLLTNSAHAVEDGGAISVHVAAFPDGEGVILSVADDGAGIPPGQIETIWDPFFTTKEGGTGLGLPICRQIVELHGGTITVESVPGEGTRFLVLIPKDASRIIPEHGPDPDR